MTDPPLWRRLKNARAVQILVVYLGACWFVLQLVATLRELLALPVWIGPLTVVLLGIGALVVGATAWVQSLPATTVAEEAGERPSDWQVAPADALQRLRAGRLPHLTWARAIVGGVVAISLAIGVAGGYVLVTGGAGLEGTSRAGGEAAATAVAVLPFQTRGEELGVYGEGMVDLLTINLEGLEGIRTINSGTVIARWRSEVGSDLTAELEEALSVARRLDARYAVRGSLVPAGSSVRIVADVFDLTGADSSPIDGVQVEGSADDLLGLVDELTVDLARVFVGSAPGSALLAGAITTPSLEALEAYLRGEALYRRSRFYEAIDAFEAAVAADSMFALAHWRLLSAWSWTPEMSPQLASELGARVSAVAERLPERQRTLAEASLGVSDGRSNRVGALRAHLSRHPDDGEAWYWLSEYAFHTPWLSRSDEVELETALQRAVDLEPTFGPYYIHLLARLIAIGDEEAFRSRLSQYAANAADPATVELWSLYWDFFRGSGEAMARAEELFRTTRTGEVIFLSLVAFLSDDLSPRMLLVHDMTPPDFVNSFPGYFRGHDVAVGRSPMPPKPGESAPWLSWMNWHLLVERELELPADLLDDLSAPDDALQAALVAAASGNRGIRDAALRRIAPGQLEARTPLLGFYFGAATLVQAERTTEALLQLRAGDPGAAEPLLDTVLQDSAYDAVAVLLAGDAKAALGNWDEAVGLWRTLLPTAYRPHVRLRLGRGHDALGDTDRAAANYRAFLTMMSDPDAAVRPLVDEARAALVRLGG
jgi:tetratricopeptide (TPR) repeat protein